MALYKYYSNYLRILAHNYFNKIISSFYIKVGYEFGLYQNFQT